MPAGPHNYVTITPYEIGICLLFGVFPIVELRKQGQ